MSIRLKKKLLPLIVLFNLIACPCFAATYYVAQTSSGAGDASSYANRDDWATFNQAALTDGDTVYVAGNITSTMTITADAGAAYINIYPCSTAYGASQSDVGTIIAVNSNASTYINLEGHVIDGTGGAVQGVMLQSVAGTTDHFQLKDCEVRDAAITGVQIGSDSATAVTNIIIDGCTIHGNDEEGIYLHTSADNLTIQNNEIYGNGVDGQGDGIDGKPKIANLVVDNNTIHDIDATVDGSEVIGMIIQSEGAIVKNNYLYSLEGGGGDAVRAAIKIFAGGYKDNSATYNENITDIKVYNNLILADLATFGIDFGANASWTESGVDIQNNTFSNPVSACIYWNIATNYMQNTVLENNIFLVPAGAVYVYRISNGITIATAVADSDYNCMYSADGASDKIFSLLGTTRAFTYWQSTYSFDETASFQTNPSLNVSYIPDSVTDPVVDTGKDLSATFTTDRSGQTRTTPWDIGAYQLPVQAVATGTLIANLTESGIVAGGDTIIITLTSAQWVATAGDNNAITTAIINGIDSAQAEAAGWDAVVKVGLDHTHVVRTSSTVLTITLPAFATYNITSAEEVTDTIPASATDYGSSIVATPTTWISPELITVETFSTTYNANGPSVTYNANGPAIVAP